MTKGESSERPLEVWSREKRREKWALSENLDKCAFYAAF